MLIGSDPETANNIFKVQTLSIWEFMAEINTNFFKFKVPPTKLGLRKRMENNYCSLTMAF